MELSYVSEIKEDLIEEDLLVDNTFCEAVKADLKTELGDVKLTVEILSETQLDPMQEFETSMTEKTFITQATVDTYNHEKLLITTSSGYFDPFGFL